MSNRNKKFLLVVLAVLLAVAIYANYPSSQSAVVPGVAVVDSQFQPLKVEDPSLRFDLLEKVRRTEYKSDQHHDIFNFGPPEPTPAQKSALAKIEQPQHHFVGPQKPPPPEPPQVPATFFGYAINPATQNRLGFFSKEDDVFIVGEGGLLFNRFRLVRIGNNSAEFEEVGSGLHATLSMAEPDQLSAQQQQVGQQQQPPRQEQP